MVLDIELRIQLHDFVYIISTQNHSILFIFTETHYTRQITMAVHSDLASLEKKSSNEASGMHFSRKLNLIEKYQVDEMPSLQ